MLQIPLINAPSQTLTIIIDNIEYSLRIIYNTREETWSMDISSSDFELTGISLVGGVDLLSQHTTPINNIYMINVSGLTIDANIDTLGTEVVLVIATSEEIEEAS